MRFRQQNEEAKMSFLTNLLKALRKRRELTKAKKEYRLKKMRQARAAEAVQNNRNITVAEKIIALIEYSLEDFLSDRYMFKKAIEDYIGEVTRVAFIVEAKFPYLTYYFEGISKAKFGKEFTSLTGKYLALSELMGLSIKEELHPKIMKAYHEWKSNPGLQEESKRILRTAIAPL